MVSTGSEVGQRKGPESAEHASVPHHSLKVAPSTHRGGGGGLRRPGFKSPCWEPQFPNVEWVLHTEALARVP